MKKVSAFVKFVVLMGRDVLSIYSQWEFTSQALVVLLNGTAKFILGGFHAVPRFVIY